MPKEGPPLGRQPAREYRIRWARVEVCNGYRCWHERRCLAERRVPLLFGAFSIWVPVDGTRPRCDEAQAMADIEADRALRAPLPPTLHVT